MRRTLASKITTIIVTAILGLTAKVKSASENKPKPVVNRITLLVTTSTSLPSGTKKMTALPPPNNISKE